ncbi:DUF3619 family protein [Niveibacterium sp. 24ML]|uniref:DUF3619 family protein n=1 Tax=Niveibacterium sp. 24ML TaxID=2985512 RepID=UPI00226E96C8|nr:DUF3619 family protein [Niveibacterium sp. 24ML]MCX9157618.1 DUF3619 family protein [Niveibacterium sp. 24ML]
MTEDTLIARRIATQLDRGTGELRPEVLERLRTARRSALEHHRIEARGLSLAGVGRTVSDMWAQHSRLAFAMITAVVLLAAADTLRDNVIGSELEEIDSALLSDDLPIDAYLDHGFDRWLKPDDSAS